MSKIYTALLFLILFSTQANAQCDPPNAGLENWTNQPLTLTDFSDQEFTQDIFLPDSTTSFLRFFIMAFSAAFDDSYIDILVNDPVGFIGIDQSEDASEGDYAVKLQGAYDVNFADLYSPHDCTEVPDSFYFDVKHFGDESDSLDVYVIFDQGLNGIPNDAADLANFPAYASVNLVYTEDTEYERLALPVIENFAADVDTFYYLIIATTHNDSYFLIDNIQSGSGGSMSTCIYDNDQATYPLDVNPICVCDGFEPDEYIHEGNFINNFVMPSVGDQMVMILSASDEILSTSTGSMDDLFEEDFCGLEDVFAIQVLFDGTLTGAEEGNNLSDLSGCFKLSEKTPLTLIDESGQTFVMSGNGIDLDSNEEVLICKFDDIIDVFSFSSDYTLNSTIIILDDFDSIAGQIDADTDTDFEFLEPGEYTLGVFVHQGDLPNLVGVDVDDLVAEACFFFSDNFYELIILGNGDTGCISATQDQSLLDAFRIQTNPVDQILSLQAGKHAPENVIITIKDINGHTIMSQSHTNVVEQIAINVSELHSAVYFLSIHSENHQATQKFIKI